MPRPPALASFFFPTAILGDQQWCSSLSSEGDFLVFCVLSGDAMLLATTRTRLSLTLPTSPRRQKCRNGPGTTAAATFAATTVARAVACLPPCSRRHGPFVPLLFRGDRYFGTLAGSVCLCVAMSALSRVLRDLIVGRWAVCVPSWEVSANKQRVCYRGSKGKVGNAGTIATAAAYTAAIEKNNGTADPPGTFGEITPPLLRVVALLAGAS